MFVDSVSQNASFGFTKIFCRLPELAHAFMAFKEKRSKDKKPGEVVTEWPTIADDKKEDEKTSEGGVGVELPVSGEDGWPDHATSSVKQLYCRTGYNLAVDADGRVYGTMEEFGKNAILRLSSDEVGEVRIRGEEAGMYVAMDDDGMLYGQKSKGNDESVFYEQHDGRGWNSYLSKKYASREWFLAIKKSGRPKKGSLTAPGQKATQFLPRPAQPGV